jgi:hypothetical protein
MLKTQPDRYEMLLKASENLINKVGNHEDRIVHIENHMPMNRRKALNLKNLASKHVTSIVGGYGSQGYKDNYRKVIRKLWHDYWNNFGITSYLETPAKMYDTAIQWIQDWRYTHDSEDDE